jgi:4-amino-4-deoxy-L-arabinose transferase-like glycosyltransferase
MRRFDLPAVTVLAVALRLVVLFLWSPELSGDALDYDRLARSLVAGRGYVNPMGDPTSWRPPLYPAFVAVGYILSGRSIQSVRVLQAGLDIGTVIFTYVIGYWLFGRKSGLVAALLVALNPGTIAATGRLLSETLFTLLFMAGIAGSVSWLGAIRDNRRVAAVATGIAAGALLGAGTLTRGVLLLYPLVLVGLALVTVHVSTSSSVCPGLEGWRTALLGCLALLLAFGLTLTPWLIRNYRVQGAFVPVTTEVGMTLYASYNPPQGWIFGMLPHDEVTAGAERLPEPQASATLVRAALASIQASPLKAMKLEFLKILYFWAPFDWEILPFYGAFNPVYAFIALWALVYGGLWGWRKNVLATAAAWLPIVFLFGMALVFYGSPRLRLPAEPLLALFAATQLVSLDRLAGRRRSRAVVISMALCLAIISIFAGSIKQVAKERMFAPTKGSTIPPAIAARQIAGYDIRAPLVQPQSREPGQHEKFWNWYRIAVPTA